MYSLSFTWILLGILSLGFIERVVSAPASVASIHAEDLVEYEQEPETIKRLIDASLDLTRKKLAYTYGSASPSKGGMDCSGAISYILKSRGLKEAPRMSHTIYHWTRTHGNLTSVNHVHHPNHPNLRTLKPGDLVFWEGTYAVTDRNPPISHVMLYLGTLKKDGKGVLFGASSGRRFRGKKIHGVSVFDFKVPAQTSKARLVAFGPAPGIRKKEAPAPPKPSESPRQEPLKNILKAFSKKESEPPAGR